MPARKVYEYVIKPSDIPDLYQSCVVYNNRALGLTHHRQGLLMLIDPASRPFDNPETRQLSLDHLL